MTTGMPYLKAAEGGQFCPVPSSGVPILVPLSPTCNPCVLILNGSRQSHLGQPLWLRVGCILMEHKWAGGWGGGRGKATLGCENRYE